MVGNFVSNTSTVNHTIALTEADWSYINSTATTVLTYWFVDCVYYGPSKSMSFAMQYKEVDQVHKVEALIVAGFEPITTTTTSTTPAPTTSTKSTTTIPKQVTLKPSTQAAGNSSSKPKVLPNAIASDGKNITKRSVPDNSTQIMVRVNGTLVPYNGSFPYVCLNDAMVANDARKVYGYFNRNFTVKGRFIIFLVFLIMVFYADSLYCT